VLFASVLVLVGAAVQLYVIIIGGQAFPLSIFPGYDVTSAVRDGVVAGYRPSLPEALLGFGGVALALATVLVAVKVLRILPDRLVSEPATIAESPADAPAASQKARPAAA
jgi:molybdopterin-containing oxidoreductase family membrane subunit